MNKTELFPSLLFTETLEINTNPYLNYIYHLKEQDLGRKISNRGGWQSNELVNNLFFLPLTNLIQSQCSKIHNIEYKIVEMWANISPQYAHNQIHNHSSLGPNIISGVLYIQTPPDSGDLVLYNPSNISQFFEISPKENNLIFFDSTLPHSVNQNHSQQDRISIAFNLSPLHII